MSRDIDRARVVAVLLAVALGAAGAHAGLEARCGTPGRAPGDPAARSTTSGDDPSEATTTPAVTVPVYWHVIHARESGKLEAGDIAAALDVLNDSFSGATGGAATRFSFVLAETTYTDHAIWYDSCDSPNVEAEMKETLRRGGSATLNVYSCGIRNTGQYGWATYPWSYEEDPPSDGVVLLHETVPGGNAAPYNEGDTLTHEVGHWLGLYHTFEGGCDGEGDLVDDTPPQAGQVSGCPVGTDSCAGGGLDPVENFMAYTDDACMTEFTSGQSDRTSGMWDAYRATPSGCTSDADCDDGNFCNGGETCSGGACSAGLPPDCDDDDPCTDDVCLPAGCSNPPIDCAGSVPDGDPETPMTAALDASGRITLTWSDSCGAGDASYAVFQGAVGSFASHEPLSCDTQGATSFTFAPDAGDLYFLVAPLSPSREGSLGRQSDGNVRPQGLDRCLPRAIESCR